MRKFLAALTAGFLAISVLPAEAADSDELIQVQVPAYGSGGWIGIDFIDLQHHAQSLLTVGNAKSESNYDQWRTVICTSAMDAACQIEGYYFDVFSIFSPCTIAVTTNCIETLKATLPSGEVVTAVPGKLWNRGGEYKGDELLGIPDGGSAATWTIKGSNPGGSEEYVLIAGVTGGINVPSMSTQLPGTSPNQNVFRGNVFAYLQPVTISNGKYDDPAMRLIGRGTGGTGIGGGVSDHLGCMINDTNQCALRASFPLNVTYSLTMKFATNISPWLRGRLVEPSINVVTAPNEGTTLSISAKPMSAPLVAGYINWATAPDWLKSQYPAGTGGTASSPDAFTTTNLDTRILRVSVGSSGDLALKSFKEWIPFLKDKPLAMKTYWNLQTIEGQQSPKMQSCAMDSFAGIVTSNSTVYSAGAPAWNEERQTLDYTVGAPHYDTQGNVLVGQYVLSMKSDVARCLYGFSSAPISAKVEIASEDGNPNIATTVIKEDKVTGFLTLVASGFHYSTSQVSVQLTQSSVTTPEPSPTPKKVTAKTITIKCVKGKTTKKITGKAPKCPAGYKKTS